MYIDEIITSPVLTDNYVSATQCQPVQSAEEINPVFTNDIVSIGEVESPYQTYSATSVAKPESTGVFDIGSHYSISEEEVIPSIREVRSTINNTDLSEKTDVEKYDWIENKFVESFGSDFMMAHNLNLPSSMYYLIGVEYTDTLSKFISDPEQVNRQRLYGDATTTEIQNKIRDEYPETLTNGDLFLMVNDMRNAGVLDGNSLRSIGIEGTQRVLDTLGLIKSYSIYNTQAFNGEVRPLSIEDRDKRWMRILDDPVKVNNLLRLYNEWTKSGKVALDKETADFLVDFMGGKLGSDGLFILESFHGGINGNIHGIGYGERKEIDWDALLDQLLKEMDAHEEFVRGRMALIDAEDTPATQEIPCAEENLGTEGVTGEEGSTGAEEFSSASESSSSSESSDSGGSEDKIAA